MALGMRRWLTTIFVGCALVALWKLPPEALPSPQPRPVTGLQAQRDELTRLNAEAQTAWEALLRYRWSDSIVKLALAQAADGSAVAVPRGSGLDADEMAELTALVRTEVRAADPMPDAPVFAYVYQPFDHGRIGERPFSRQERTEVYAGQLDGRAYCIQLRVIDPDRVRPHFESMLRGTDLLTEPESTVAGCRPYLRHGLPGSAVRTWLENGALALAARTGEPVEQAGFQPIRRLPFGLSAFAGTSVSLDVDQCMTGRSDACRRLMLEPDLARGWSSRGRDIARSSPATSLGGPSSYLTWLPEHAFFLSDLEAEFGREAFGRFWTSEEPVAEAFRSAFGMDLGVWTVEWLDRAAGLDDRGPELPRSASTGTFLTVALMLGIAFVMQRRRQVA